MFKKKEVISEKVETLIGVNSNFKGELKSEGTIRIDGQFEGTIETKNDLIVGEKGNVKADILARHILVAGQINGNIKAEGKLEMNSTGKIIGDMNVQNVVIEEGAVFKGNCTMQSTANSKTRKHTEIKEANA